MDPLVASLILFAGLVMVAGAFTGLVAAAPAAPTRLPLIPRQAAPRTDAAASVECPRSSNWAKIRLGIEPFLGQPSLTVLQCEYFGDGPVMCEMDCLDQPLRGEPAAA